MGLVVVEEAVVVRIVVAAARGLDFAVVEEEVLEVVVLGSDAEVEDLAETAEVEGLAADIEELAAGSGEKGLAGSEKVGLAAARAVDY